MGLTESIQRIILDAFHGARITSASPGHINEVIDVGFTGAPDLDKEIQDVITESAAFKRFSKNTDEKVTKIEENPMLNITKEQTGNILAMATNPAGFLIGTVLKKFARGAGVAALAIILFEAVKTIVEELFKPGRILDTRFRESIDRQILVFMNRKEQRELDAGIRPFITTTVGGLRGASLAGQVGGNLYNPFKMSKDFLDVRRVKTNNPISQRAQLRQFLSPSRLVAE